MSVDREELKRLIDQIPDQDALEVYDFIGYLNIKREKDEVLHLDVVSISEDVNLSRQIMKSREDRENGRIYGQKSGLKYLRSKIEEFERGQDI
ncbi:MAG: hypothetical protein KGZ96_01475 [Clostridia bacterium]|nr:hypothetical protein [Clostridia bacterium]